jgi:hypothetical protein
MLNKDNSLSCTQTARYQCQQVRDCVDLPNWHPTLLINCDEKPLMRMPTTRLQPNLAPTIDPSQSGLIKSHSIFDNL